MITHIMSSYDKYNGLWRASANEAVPYTDDFPECLLVAPEFWDGSIVQGNATVVMTTIKWISDTQLEVIIRDNGAGIKNLRRLLEWAAAKSLSTIHKNGHGLKKAMTKFMRDFSKAEWLIKYRVKNRNLQTIHAPFLGYDDTRIEENEQDEVTLMPSGFEIRFKCEASVLGDEYSGAPQKLFHALREIITTRYSEKLLRSIDFQLEIQKDDFTVKGSSLKDEWHSFEYNVQKRIPEEVTPRMEIIQIIPGGKWIYREYMLTVNGQKKYELKSDTLFPVYGVKNQKGSRVHTFVDGRMIDAIPYYKILGRDMYHNSLNGLLGFWHFTSDSIEDFDKMPQPATTKVSFYENDPVYKEAVMKLRTRRQEEEDAQEKKRQQEEQRVAAERAVVQQAKAAEEKQKQISILDAMQRASESETNTVITPQKPVVKAAAVQEAANSEKALYRKLKVLTDRLKKIDYKEEIEYGEATPNVSLLATFKAIDRINKTLDEI